MIFNKLLRISSNTLEVYQFRDRATYYKQSNKWPPRFIRRFFIRYPRALLYATLGLLIGSFLVPTSYWIYKYNTMSNEEFKVYTDNHNKVVENRQRYGVDLWFPWKTGKKEEVK
uniref:Uncharacterized protein n=1 Tax=Strongyloides venezuelensis TaxID=75913 RepID=A0A0K0FSC4_STRVS